MRFSLPTTTLGRAFGLTPDRGTPLDILVGVGIGAVAMFGIFGTEWALRAITVEGLGGFSREWYLWFLALVVMAGLEELLSRCFVIQGLMVLLKGRKWVAVGISAALFGFAHAASPDASVISVIGNALGGVVYAVAFLGTGALWMSWGLHFSWNFFQGQVLGFPVSGLTLPGLVAQTAPGPEWLTGAAYGPEAGAVGIAFRFVVIALLFGWLKHRRAAASWKDVLLLR
ncbi:MAG: CPBP family intramembrane metalloprotease [Gemmatimonadota bacterium]